MRALTLRTTRGIRLGVLVLAAGMVLAGARAGLAKDEEAAPERPFFTMAVTSPGTGNQLVAGSTITITWTSSSPNQNVGLWLGDVDEWIIHSEITASTSDDGSYTWQIPANTAPGEYLVYVEKADASEWAYGGTFEILACGTQSQLRAPSQPRIDTSRRMPRPERDNPRLRRHRQ